MEKSENLCNWKSLFIWEQDHTNGRIRVYPLFTLEFFVLCSHCFLVFFFLLSADTPYPFFFLFFSSVVFVIEGIYSLVYHELDLYGILL